MTTRELRLFVLYDRAMRRLKRRLPSRRVNVRTAPMSEFQAALALHTDALRLCNRLWSAHLDNLSAARLKVKRSARCAGCGDLMTDEFYKGKFDGVMNDGFLPFHHGCEDF